MQLIILFYVIVIAIVTLKNCRPNYSYFLLLKVRFHYENRIEQSLFLLLIFPRLKLKRALSKAKKSIKQTKNTLFHARSENGSQQV